MVLLITLNGIKSVIKMICLAVWEGKKGKVQVSIFFFFYSHVPITEGLREM